jgi:hypothetical protein
MLFGWDRSLQLSCWLPQGNKMAKLRNTASYFLWHGWQQFNSAFITDAKQLISIKAVQPAGQTLSRDITFDL